jgi:hypothetical protein
MFRPILTALLLLSAAAARADDPPAAEQDVLARMPVKEITVFKDGHAFVLHEGVLPTDENGNVVLDYLPTPVIGTFWPYASEGPRLTSVVAGSRTIGVERTALDVRGLLEANVGARVTLKFNNQSIHGTIERIAERNAAELARTSPPNTAPQLPQKGSVLLLATDEGIRVVPIDQVQEVTFRDPPRRSGRTDELRNVLTLRLAWPENQPAAEARVGMAYLQRGIRWIPSYRVTLDGEGTAHVELSATLLNELTDLEDVTAHLVIGVPTFAFKETIDPISLQQALADLSQYFQQGSDTAYMMSNSIMTQTARMGEYRAPPQAQPGANLGPEVAGGGQNEDLFLFTVEHVTLRKGERMVVPVAEFDLKYEDVYTLRLPFAPPAEVRQQINGQQQAELAKLFHAPKVMHQLRLINDSEYPLTTAPALIVADGRVLAQSLMTYTARGATTDLEVTAAVNVQITHADEETARDPAAVAFEGNQIGRVELSGKVHLANYSGRPIKLEVTREVLGAVDSADHDGAVTKVNVHEQALPGGGYPDWWGWYSWPYWWWHFNGIGRAEWKLELDAAAEVDLGYTWHYYWR